MLSILCLLQVSLGSVPMQAPGDSALPASMTVIATQTRFESLNFHFPIQPVIADYRLAMEPAVVDTERTVAIEYSDGYYTRATVHKYASYATLPLFVLQY